MQIRLTAPVNQREPIVDLMTCLFFARSCAWAAPYTAPEFGRSSRSPTKCFGPLPALPGRCTAGLPTLGDKPAVFGHPQPARFHFGNGEMKMQ